MRSVARESLPWSALTGLAASEWMELLRSLEDVCVNPWTDVTSRRRVWKEENAVILAADASDDRCGYVIFGQGRQTITHSFSVPKELHIFTKELIAARAGLHHISKDMKDNSHVTLLEDNAAAAAIRQLYTLSERGIEIIQEIAELTKGIVLTVVNVRSEDNPADAPSRLRPVDEAKLAPVMDMALHAPPYQLQPSVNRCSFGGERHPEPTDVEEEL